MEMLIFLIFAALALASAVVVVGHRSPVYSTMALVVTLFSMAVLFVVLGAPFIGVLQVLIYTGAIVVLFLFVIMLLNVGREEVQPSGQRAQAVMAILGAVVFGGLVMLAVSGVQAAAFPQLTPEMVSVKGLARELFRDYLLPFEIVGLLLLVAVIGATVAARKPPQVDVSSPDPKESEP
ncbi:MAG TPA: NADH-quinone oxidoreductase subunit J [Thermoanaerobaculia bacterium]